MRNLYDPQINRYRDRSDQVKALWGFVGDETCGVFFIPSPIDQAPLKVIASAGEGWDHVSVSRQSRIPNWTEMEAIKRTFFRDEEIAMQLHVPPRAHINVHNNCLHLWRPQREVIPMPPSEFV